ncbi:iron-sulfur cluster assembly scaffold protein [Sphingosinicella soli]|uniref:NifU-like protein involved in Fe-S cluster formation n=1 Tax=Sphingosinicella soli TaxID=333708 RepID=A0A7W7F8L2_9SPHN|nr:iron-sulfur cluster assembly scaffold protein [Sphingosinicella soli]MBB4631778.1 NifU-like protein involved in Fe-S cluster formation [Sphingosinicella soli]
MSEPLYNTAILRLAATIPHQTRLESPQGTSRKVSPICGSRVTADVVLDAAGRVAAFGQEVRACALGQASASILGSSVLGRSTPELRAAHTALASFLKGEGSVPDSWPDLEIFRPAQAYKARHPSILLAFDAAASAAEEAAVTASA